MCVHQLNVIELICNIDYLLKDWFFNQMMNHLYHLVKTLDSKYKQTCLYSLGTILFVDNQANVQDSEKNYNMQCTSYYNQL